VLVERQLEADERVDVLAPRAPHDDPSGGRGRLVERLADRVHVLMPETEAEPCVHQLRVRGGDDRVVRRLAGRDPGRGRRAVEVADDLGRQDGVTGGLDPHVRPPDLVERHAEEVAGDLATAERNDSRRTLPGEERRDLGTGQVGVLVPRVEGRLDATAGGMPSREQDGGPVEMLLGERFEGRGSGRGDGHASIVGAGRARLRSHGAEDADG
jgi:hypothetical protein